GDPFSKIIHFEDIGAQRGLDNSSALEADEEEPQGRRGIRRHATKLSRQLRKYFNQNLDPLVAPAAEDLQALQAIHSARVEFGRKLENSFSKALQELQDLGYPGITDPKLSIAAEINAMDTLNHPSAVQYAVPTHGSLQTYQLPEGSNGLGYQNLLSIVFALMSSRDRWMRVGKAAVKHTVVNTIIPPLHLVLVEEPEAHLHAPVQQVFIKRAYDVLRNHDDLRKSTALRTQLVVSTHSSHIAHQADFASLRYFRRLPLNTVPGSVPTSSVVNLSDIFGDTNETTRFVKRYIKVTHCDLFFADGAILVEGAAERIILPHLVSARPAYERLDRCYVTWLEIGGSHAHRLRSLLEHLGLDTLVITDLDAMDASTKKASPKRNAGLKTRNKTLATWIPKETSLDALLDTDRAALEATNTNGASVRVCYQQPVKIEFKGKMAEALANTFEDALLYENIAMFQGLSGPGIVARFRNALNSSADLEALGESLRSALSDGSKAEFALDILLADETFITSIAVPKYIHEGLVWLAERLTRRDEALALSAGLPQ
ncbi:MAG TPA: AAA family ATPase, partial [Polyangiaceae bacterium]|nr:AAA family ATPase [Polyangiaceae bacterium]